MQTLISELIRLYLPAGATSPDVLARHLSGESTRTLSLTGSDGLARALVIPFRKVAEGTESQHWELLCTVANALQVQLGLPAPAVSITGADGYALWLSFQTPMRVAQLQQFLALLHKAYFPDTVLASAGTPVAVPPCLNPASGKWAAFIHPGLGASFADEAGLDMAPPPAGQIALLEKVTSITHAQLLHALGILEQKHGPIPVAAEVPVVREAPPVAGGLLLKDATLDDIVRHLHALHIEPTFRYLLHRPRGDEGP